MARFRKTDESAHQFFKGRHKFEHWYRNNSIYFISARCRDRYRAFDTNLHHFVPIIASLMDNHYHLLGYLADGNELGPMMRKLHGSVAKLVNDILPERRVPFWRGGTNDDYFDGCLRSGQFSPTYRYVLRQSVRHGIVKHHRDYPHTRIFVDHDRALHRALELRAFIEDVSYKRYDG
jgi:hypothetical protein